MKNFFNQPKVEEKCCISRVAFCWNKDGNLIGTQKGILRQSKKHFEGILT